MSYSNISVTTPTTLRLDNVSLIRSQSVHLWVTGPLEQFRYGYDSTHYFSGVVDSSGNTTFSLTGTTPVFTFGQKIVHSAPTTLKGYTVGTLPTGTQGDICFVTDALAPIYLVTVVGGGAIVTPVFFDGTNWVAY